MKQLHLQVLLGENIETSRIYLKKKYIIFIGGKTSIFMKRGLLKGASVD